MSSETLKGLVHASTDPLPLHQTKIPELQPFYWDWSWLKGVVSAAQIRECALLKSDDCISLQSPQVLPGSLVVHRFVAAGQASELPALIC